MSRFDKLLTPVLTPLAPFAASALVLASAPALGQSRPADAGQLIERLDRDRNGGLSREEIPVRMQRLRDNFERIDFNADGRITADELETLARARARRAAPAGSKPARAAGGPPATSAVAVATGAAAIDRRMNQAISGQELPGAEQHAGAGAGEWQPEVVLLGEAGRHYLDPELHESQRLMTFQDAFGAIWLAAIDPETGLFSSADGLDTQMDSAALPLLESFNGPEFGIDATGWSVYYTKPGATGMPQIWRAWLDGGTPVAAPLLDDGQLKLVDARTGETQTITADAGIKSFAFGWRAPEFGDLLVLALIDDQAVGIWRDTGGAFWERIATLTPPAGVQLHGLRLARATGRQWQTLRQPGAERHA